MIKYENRIRKIEKDIQLLWKTINGMVGTAERMKEIDKELVKRTKWLKKQIKRNNV